jgi:hypothetical protein
MKKLAAGATLIIAGITASATPPSANGSGFPKDEQCGLVGVARIQERLK